MDSSRNAPIKIAIFAVVTLVFVGLLIIYTEARQHGRRTDYVGRTTNHEAFGHNHDGRKHFEKSFIVEPGGDLMLDTDFGDVEVSGWEKAEVEVSTDVEGDSEALEDFDLEYRQSDNQVEVRGVWKGDDWKFWDRGLGLVLFKVRVPHQFGVEVSTAGGDISLRVVEGTVSVETSGGDLRVENVQGVTTAETSGGDITVSQVLGDVRLETSGGDILASGVRGDVQAETSGGDIDVTVDDGRVDAGTSGGDIKVRVEGVSRGLSLGTSGGDIVIYLSRDVTATVDASASGGDVECELEILTRGEKEDDELQGKINGGGERIEAETSGGDISIRALE